MTVTDLLLDLAGTYRATRLLAKDDILNRPRDALIRFAYNFTFDEDRMPATREARDAWDQLPGEWSRHATQDPHPPALALVLTCRWCLSVYVAAGILAGYRYAPAVTRTVMRVLAMSAAAGLLAAIEDD